MAKFKVTDPSSGRTVILTSQDNTPPSEQELEQIFGQQTQPQPTQEPVGQPKGIDWENPLATGGVPLVKTAKTIGKGLELYDKNIRDPFSEFVVGGVEKLAGKPIDSTTKLPQTMINPMFPMLPIKVGETTPRESAKEAVAMGAEQLATGGAGLLARKLTAPKEIPSLVKGIYTKAIRPSVTSKATREGLEKYRGQAAETISDITKNKGNLGLSTISGETRQLPKNLEDFSIAIKNRKKDVYKKYSELTKQATANDATVDISPMLAEASKIANSGSLNSTHPEAAEYARKFFDRNKDRVFRSPLELEEMIENWNSSLKTFYKNPTYQDTARVGIDAMLSNVGRSQLDKTILSSTGQQYAPLKKLYGSLAEIEKDVNRRLLVDARKSKAGFFDLGSIMTAGDLASAISRLDPAYLATGAARQGVISLLKKMNDPNRMVKSLFKQASRSFPIKK